MMLIVVMILSRRKAQVEYLHKVNLPRRLGRFLAPDASLLLVHMISSILKVSSQLSPKVAGLLQASRAFLHLQRW